MDRRSFLGSLGSAILGARLLDGGAARAQAAPAARRLIIVFSPDGTEHDVWRPTMNGSRMEFGEGSILEPLARRWQDLTVVDGVAYTEGVEHYSGMVRMLTNIGFRENVPSVTNGMSLDQYVASRLPSGPRFPSLELGVQCSIWGLIPEARMSFSGTGQTVPSNEDPRDVFRRLFQGPGEDALRRLARQQSVLDVVREDARSLSARLSGEERQKLELHLESLRQMERALEPGPECPDVPALSQLDPWQNDNFPALGRAQTDLMVAALACDLTRVASLQWSMAASPTVFTWLNHAESHHSLSHVVGATSQGGLQFIQGERWFSEQFLYLLDRLAAIPEPTEPQGSLLDHSIVLWMTEVGDRITHHCEDMPIVIAGGGSGRLRPGRYLHYTGESHGKLLTSLCHAMGLDNPSFGNATHGEGELPGLLA
ncbi:MAG: DUF1552 domain-containing protein [Myxococcales bacterium]|nr:DUF1552 domain-containing protein [Myxococcales bacterium]MCB9650773.1 DUF1552 domain-containing protein [Deltaproteobacteria bacterium]